jgi:Protein of unknown function (DUF2490)
MYRKTVFLMLSIFFVNCQYSFCQIGLWTKIAAEKKITKKLDAHLIFQSRMDEIKLPINTLIGEAGISYKIAKNLELGGYYRYIGKLKKGTYRPFHRYFADLSYKFTKLKPINLAYRLRYQKQFKDDKTDGIIPDKNYWRNKFDISFNNKSKFEPFVSADIFTLEGGATDNIRYKIGTEIKISKIQSAELALQADDVQKNTKPTLYRIAISYKVKF